MKDGQVNLTNVVNIPHVSLLFHKTSKLFIRTIRLRGKGSSATARFSSIGICSNGKASTHEIVLPINHRTLDIGIGNGINHNTGARSIDKFPTCEFQDERLLVIIVDLIIIHCEFILHSRTSTGLNVNAKMDVLKVKLLSLGNLLNMLRVRLE